MVGRHERSAECYEEIFRLATPLGESWHRANALMALGLDARRTGDLVRAVELQRSALEIRLGLDDQLSAAMSLEALMHCWSIRHRRRYRRCRTRTLLRRRSRDGGRHLIGARGRHRGRPSRRRRVGRIDGRAGAGQIPGGVRHKIRTDGNERHAVPPPVTGFAVEEIVP
jgi:hypothetical protein